MSFCVTVVNRLHSLLLCLQALYFNMDYHNLSTAQMWWKENKQYFDEHEQFMRDVARITKLAIGGFIRASVTRNDHIPGGNSPTIGARNLPRRYVGEEGATSTRGRSIMSLASLGAQVLKNMPWLGSFQRRAASLGHETEFEPPVPRDPVQP